MHEVTKQARLAQNINVQGTTSFLVYVAAGERGGANILLMAVWEVLDSSILSSVCITAGVLGRLVEPKA